MKPGTQLGPRVIESVSGAAMHDIALVLDDPNPIHLSGEAAAAAGLGDRPVNQGPVNFGYVLDMLREAVPGAVVRDIRVRLLANVFAGDRVTAAGRVESVEPDRDGRFVARCAVWLDVDGGGRAVEGTALLVLPVGLTT
jgi:3-hydroxybutyryl-CoA dehydratase